MAYTPTNWARGDVVTSAKLNKLEKAAAPFIVTFTIDWDSATPTATADKTLAEIETAWDAGQNVFFEMDGTIAPAQRALVDDAATWTAVSTDYQDTLMTVIQCSIDGSGTYVLYGEYTLAPA